MEVWTTTPERTGIMYRSKKKNKFHHTFDKRLYSDEYNKKAEIKPQMEMLYKEFVETTTLPGIGQICKRPKIKWKLFWLVISVCATIMALYQSWPILKDFIEGRTVQSTTYNPEFEFPSVTVCSNIRFTAAMNDTFFNGNALPFVDPDNVTSIIDFVEIVHRKSRELGVEPFQTSNFNPLYCNFNRKYCELGEGEDLHFFSTALYGRCITFNVGTKHVKIGRPNSNLNMKFRMEKYDRKLDFNENYLSLWLHPPATAPVLYRSESTRIYPGDTIDVRFEMKRIERLPKRGNDCAHPLTDERRFQSIFYNNYTEYIYSPKACNYNLLYETKKNNYNCLDPAIPRNKKWKTEWASDRYNICNPGNNLEMNPFMQSDGNETEFSTLFNFDANCSLPCYEWMIEFTSTSTSTWFEAMVANSLSTNKDTVKSVKWNSNYAELKIGLGAAMVEVVTEAYRYTPGDFAGIIGGNIGFWVGLCAISLAELVEFGVLLLYIVLKRFTNATESGMNETKIIYVKSPKV